MFGNLINSCLKVVWQCCVFSNKYLYSVFQRSRSRNQQDVPARRTSETYQRDVPARRTSETYHFIRLNVDIGSISTCGFRWCLFVLLRNEQQKQKRVSKFPNSRLKTPFFRINQTKRALVLFSQIHSKHNEIHLDTAFIFVESLSYHGKFSVCWRMEIDRNVGPRW